MADDLNKRGGQDRERIDVNQDSPEELKQAVQQVGDRADAVRQHSGK